MGCGPSSDQPVTEPLATDFKKNSIGESSSDSGMRKNSLGSHSVTSTTSAEGEAEATSMFDPIRESSAEYQPETNGLNQPLANTGSASIKAVKAMTILKAGREDSSGSLLSRTSMSTSRPNTSIMGEIIGGEGQVQKATRPNTVASSKMGMITDRKLVDDATSPTGNEAASEAVEVGTAMTRPPTVKTTVTADSVEAETQEECKVTSGESEPTTKSIEPEPPTKIEPENNNNHNKAADENNDTSRLSAVAASAAGENSKTEVTEVAPQKQEQQELKDPPTPKKNEKLIMNSEPEPKVEEPVTVTEVEAAPEPEPDPEPEPEPEAPAEAAEEAPAEEAPAEEAPTEDPPAEEEAPAEEPEAAPEEAPAEPEAEPEAPAEEAPADPPADE